MLDEILNMVGKKEKQKEKNNKLIVKKIKAHFMLVRYPLRIANEQGRLWQSAL